MTSKKIDLEDIKARIKIVCICNAIKQEKICTSILVGCDTIEKVNKKVGSGTGACQGKRCSPIIQQLIENNGIPLLTPYPLQNLDDDI